MKKKGVILSIVMILYLCAILAPAQPANAAYLYSGWVQPWLYYNNPKIGGESWSDGYVAFYANDVWAGQVVDEGYWWDEVSWWERTDEEGYAEDDEGVQCIAYGYWEFGSLWPTQIALTGFLLLIRSLLVSTKSVG